ncbi:MAG: DUF2807 domain-containing protein [Bacteroidales bacterium]|nr:DUF2807 domain-containing protein [Bacteroidales bacterium]
MKRIFSLALICALAGNLSAQTLVKEINDIRDFTGIEASGVFVIELKKGPTPSVVVEAESRYMEYIRVEVRSGVLRLYTQLPARMRLSNNATLKAYITIGELHSLELSGVCALTTSDLFTPSRFRLELSGVSKVSGLRIQTNEANMNISGASKLDLSGTAKQAKIDLSGTSQSNYNLESERVSIKASGSSKLEMQGTAHEVAMDISGVTSVAAGSFVIKNLDFSASGVSKADVHVTETLSVRMSGQSKLNHKGNPRLLDSKVSSGASVNGQRIN